MTALGPSGGAGCLAASGVLPIPDVLAWELGEALAALAARGCPVRVMPAGSPAAGGAPRWRVVRQGTGSRGEVVLLAVPEVPGRVEAGPPGHAGWESRD